MNTDAKIESLEKKISSLDKSLHGYKIGAIVMALAIVLFLGYNWKTLPIKISEAVSDEIGDETISQIDRARLKADEFLASNDFVKIGDSVSLNTYQWGSTFVRHQNGKLVISAISSDLDKQDSTFIIHESNK